MPILRIQHAVPDFERWKRVSRAIQWIAKDLVFVAIGSIDPLTIRTSS